LTDSAKDAVQKDKNIAVNYKNMKKSRKKKVIKASKLRNKKQKIIIRIAAAFTIINFILVLAFFIYLYFWLKRH